MPVKAGKHFTIPIFIPGLACPFQCVFCNQKEISGHLKIPEPDEITGLIERYLHTIDNKKSAVEIGFFGGNFTGVSVSEQEKLLKIANVYIDKGLVSSIRISTRPDYISPEILRFLKSYNVGTIELGAQSLDDDVLRLSGRGHKALDVVKASEMITSPGFSLGLQMMTGLPGDTLEKSIYTARKIISLGADNTRIYPALVIKNTKLEEMYLSGKYKPLNLDEAVLWSKELFKIFEEGRVNIIRAGLHPSEGLLSGESLVAGPFHVSFRELVLSELWKETFAQLGEASEGSITIHVPEKEYNYAVGYNGENKKLLRKNYRDVRFIKDSSLTGRQFRAYFN
ncbi:MAG: radical SAM protein [Ignavibacteria bacterium]